SETRSARTSAIISSPARMPTLTPRKSLRRKLEQSSKRSLEAARRTLRSRAPPTRPKRSSRHCSREKLEAATPARVSPNDRFSSAASSSRDFQERLFDVRHSMGNPPLRGGFSFLRSAEFRQ